MLRKHGQAIEQSFGGGIRARKHEAHCVWIEFRNLNGLAVNDQQITLRRIDCFIHINVEGEDHIVGVERMAVGKSNPLAELQGKGAAIGRDLPRFRQRGLSLLRRSVDLDEISHEASDDLA